MRGFGADALSGPYCIRQESVLVLFHIGSSPKARVTLELDNI